jgi:pantothenate kinase-related protein Tda10
MASQDEEMESASPPPAEQLSLDTTADSTVAEKEDQVEAADLLQKYVENGTFGAFSTRSKDALVAIATQERNEAEAWLLEAEHKMSSPLTQER